MSTKVIMKFLPEQDQLYSGILLGFSSYCLGGRFSLAPILITWQPAE